MSSPAIELVGVTKRYGSTTALHELSLEVEAGELVVLLGPSGCGKTTVLKVIAGLEDASDGEVYIDGRLVNYVAPKARDVAMVFQNYALYPHMTVAGNIGFPLKMAGRDKSEVRERVQDVARFLELDSELTKYPEQLSGGQRQRVALGRAIIRDPVAFLMDEPLSNLDALLRAQMREELLSVQRRVGRATVYVTHDQVEAMTMADRIVVLEKGVVQQIGTPDAVYARPANTFVASFVGSPQMNLFRGRVESGRFVFENTAIRIPWTEGGDVVVGVRPEDVELAQDGDLQGTVTLVQRTGPDAFATVTLGRESTCVVRTSAAGVREGEIVRLRFSDENVHLFAADGRRLEWRPQEPSSASLASGSAEGGC